MLRHNNSLLEMMAGLLVSPPRPTHKPFPQNDANCRDLIRDDPKTILDSYVKRAQTISFIERGFERLGCGHRTVVWVVFMAICPRIDLM